MIRRRLLQRLTVLLQILSALKARVTLGEEEDGRRVTPDGTKPDLQRNIFVCCALVLV